ncbi:MAG TPA: ATP-binding protein [Polyangiales bacterium]
MNVNAEKLSISSKGAPTSGLGTRPERLTDQFEELARVLQRSAAVCQLSAGIAHDVLNSLQVVVCESDRLAASLENPEQQDSAHALLLAARHAADLTRDLLHLARTKHTDRVPVSPNDIMVGCRRLIESLTPKRIQCSFAVDADAWLVEVVPQELEAALINLSTNARDAMPRTGSLTVSARNVPAGHPLARGLPRGDYVSFAVADSGVGMSADVLARATEAFFTTKGDTGSGLGLSTVQAFARRCGGSLRIESAPGRGTCVEIMLPRARVEPARMPAPPAVREPRDLIRTPWLRQVLESWERAARDGNLPAPTDLEPALTHHGENTVWLGVERQVKPMGFRLVHMGRELSRLLERCAMRELSREGGEALRDLGESYRRALNAGRPTYEYARFDFGEGSPFAFERLILPTSLDGRSTTHMLGVVVFVGDAGMQS